MEHVDIEAQQATSKLHSEWAFRFTNDEKYQAAIDTFVKSFEEDKRDDLRRLLGFCKALINFTRYTEADEISKKCLEIEPDNYKVKWMRVETLYKIGEFGRSLVYAYPGYQCHQCRYPFEDAIYRANDTIENCIGCNTLENVMVEMLSWINKLQEQQFNLIAKLSDDGDEFEGINNDNTKFKVNDKNYRKDYKMKKFENLLTIRYLKLQSIDKFFLENIFIILNKYTINKNLLLLINDQLQRFKQIKEINRIQKPIYTNFFKKNIPNIIIERENNEIKLKKLNIIIEINYLLNKLHETRINKNYSNFFKLVERIKNKLDTYPIYLFPMKKECLNQMYIMVGKTYIDPRDVTKFNDENTKIRYLKHHLGIKVSTIPRDEDIAWVILTKSTITTTTTNNNENKLTILELFRKRIALTSDPLELTWIYHELSKYYINKKLYDLARFYAKKSRDYSYISNSDIWTINANHLLIKIEINQHNKNEAKESAIMAYLGAQKISYNYLINFYKYTIIYIDNINFNIIKNNTNDINKREILILNLMSNNNIKMNINNLFDRMNVVPAKRRLSIMPGCKTIDKKYKISCKRNTVKDINNDKMLVKKLIYKNEFIDKIPGWMDFQE
ncbi:hypothetical protein HCN44_002852 [Aphidius gifuensis]|uniref:Uncharacterized protein n=1 Tax=Aphidius gifuensis TaxID=684658 RepID=A0A834XQ07_APHGI|nr:outer dynein arm-docking complex subunit 4-like [Aphidius gifuensis]KAF7991290.1 hypothetical protein HCN44_002852 [Aphidius gifuensis]